MRWHRAVREEEGSEVGALGRVESGDQQEVANGGLDEQKAVSERGDGEEVDEVVPGLLSPQGANGETGATT